MANKNDSGKQFKIVAILGIYVFLNIIGTVKNSGGNIEIIIGSLIGQVPFLIFLFIIFSIFRSRSQMTGIIEKINRAVKEGIPLDITATNKQGAQKTILSPVAQLIQAAAEGNLPAVSAISSVPVRAGAPVSDQLQSLLGGVWQTNKRLSRKQKYLQVALNSTLDDAAAIMAELPVSEKIIIEAGTPLIKIYGTEAVRLIRRTLPGAYVVADSKIADLAEREVEIFKKAGANAITALGVAPIDTLNDFVAACKSNNVDSMIDLMNVPSAIMVLKKLKNPPDAVILHRGVDETEKSKGKMIPYYQINQVKGNYNLLVAVAGGDTPKEIQSAVFNGADVVVVWKDFMTGGGVREVAASFLKEIK